MRIASEPESSPFALRDTLILPEEGEVHVWEVPLAGDEETLIACGGVISRDERRRADRFRSRSDAGKFIVARGNLRFILGRYAGLPPGDLEFLLSPYGKPSLGNPGESPALRFNMADSGNIALAAITRGRDVGIDLELMNPLIDISAVALRCFCGAEMDLLGATPADRWVNVFFTLWTRKEAYIKARGEGMSLDLKAIDVSAVPATLDRRWVLDDLETGIGYRGAIAVDGAIGLVRYFGVQGPAMRQNKQEQRT